MTELGMMNKCRVTELLVEIQGNEPSHNQKKRIIGSTESSALFGCKPRLNLLYLLGTNLERLRQHGVRHLGLGREHCRGERLRPRQLAVERRDDGGGRVPGVPLEVNQPAREHEHVPGRQGLGDEPVAGRGDEAHVQRALEDEDHLRGARVRVRRVHPARRVVDPGEGDAQRVQAGHLDHVGRGDHGAVGGDAGVAGDGEASEVEVV